MPSTIEGLPVPEIAVIDPALHSEDGPFGGVTDGYRLPEGTRAKALRRWYKRELPVGQPFGDWLWCESSKSKSYLQRTWARGESDILTLVLVFEKKPQPPSILVGIEQSGPC